MYNHHFKSVLTNISYFLDQGDIPKAQEILKTIDSDIKVIVTENQCYSNRLIVDVILNPDLKDVNKQTLSLMPNVLFLIIYH